MAVSGACPAPEEFELNSHDQVSAPCDESLANVACHGVMGATPPYSQTP